MNENPKLLVGLGNPGPKYELTRHNAGFQFLDLLAKSSQVGFKKSSKLHSQIAKTNRFFLCKPLTFMNRSGISVKSVSAFYSVNPKDIYVIHDDLDIKLGEYKIQFAKGPKDHNGILSIQKTLHTSKFWRIRVGIDNRKAGNRVDGEVYTLQNFAPQEFDILQSGFHKIVIDLP